jgi:hypothetical protein
VPATIALDHEGQTAANHGPEKGAYDSHPCVHEIHDTTVRIGFGGLISVRELPPGGSVLSDMCLLRRLGPDCRQPGGKRIAADPAAVVAPAGAIEHERPQQRTRGVGCLSHRSRIDTNAPAFSIS